MHVNVEALCERDMYTMTCHRGLGPVTSRKVKECSDPDDNHACVLQPFKPKNLD